MEWYEILPIILLVIFVLSLLYFFVIGSNYNKSIADITEVFSKIQKSNEIIVRNKTDLYQIEVVGIKRFLIKTLIVNPSNEIIITNSEKVIINSDIKDWKRSTKPNFVSGISEFIKFEKKEKNLIKIVLIYPDCHNITKYINESDCYVVDKSKPVDSLYFIKYKDLRDFLLSL